MYKDRDLLGKLLMIEDDIKNISIALEDKESAQRKTFAKDGVMEIIELIKKNIQ